MKEAIIFGILAVLSTVASSWDRLTSKVKKTIILALIPIIATAATQVAQIFRSAEQEKTIEEQQRLVSDAGVFMNSLLHNVDEASGGATQGDLAYVVDDDAALVFRLEYNKDEHQYHFKKELKIVDARPPEQRLDWEQQKKKRDGREPQEKQPNKPGAETDEPAPEELQLSKGMLSDLEGAAFYKGELYLTTSHANSKEGDVEPRRWVFMKVALDEDKARVTGATRSLRGIIEGMFDKPLPNNPRWSVQKWVDDGVTTVMEIEGLAIDDAGLAYLGLRAPLINNTYAWVLRAPVEDILAGHPQFESFALELKHDGENYGITSLEYDSQSRRVLILGNSPSRYKELPPMLWSWEVKDPKDLQTPEPFSGHIISKFSIPGGRPAKPEVLLKPEADRLHLLFDASGTGGQRSLRRDGMKLTVE